MVRLFLNLCKCFQQIKNFSEVEVLKHMQDSLFAEITICPACGAPAEAFHKDGCYERDFICYASVVNNDKRLELRSADPLANPYIALSIRFQISVLPKEHFWNVLTILLSSMLHCLMILVSGLLLMYARKTTALLYSL